MQDFWLIEKMGRFNRERVPERVVHAKGSAAYGTLTIGGNEPVFLDELSSTRGRRWLNTAGTC